MAKVTLSRTEQRRLEVLAQVRDGQIRLRKAAELLGLSYRQTLRLWAGYGERGAAALVHGLRGRPSNRRTDSARRERAVALYQAHYGDFGPTLAAEHLARTHGLEVDHETLRRWLTQAGLWTRRRRRAAHRAWRPRKEHVGELLQMDGSEHDWFEGRGPRCVLMVLIDDASNWTYARFYPAETSAAAFDVLGRYVRLRGLPQALYVDRDSIYRSDRQATIAEELRGEGPLTQFGRAMQRLQVRIILAHSPQAKGRVERRNGLFQDRLVKELRLAGITTIAAANAFLETHFLPDLQRRFVVAPAQPADLHRKLPRGLKLEEVLCFEEARVVQADWTVAWRHRYFQLTRANQALPLVKQAVTVREQLDGTVQLVYRGHRLAWRELPGRPTPAPVPPRPRPAGRLWKPPAQHPWRKPGKGVTPLARSLAPAASVRTRQASSSLQPRGPATSP